MSKKKTITVTGKIYNSETKDTISYTCEIPEPSPMPSNIEVEIIEQINENAFRVKPKLPKDK